ncbi:zf-TFIIB domain-containing protein [Microbacterium sp. BK668]|uniref:TFIIB-type zinc ribbon-containing protein n=1 Tax=Microbacterium sp. BK668 TaxID=2512118 RepID=UPI00105E448D|nr:zf-TFIIB domain-containing protein [Microbacterium sp. BK668]TDN90769.1 hypothetical protein EV279_0258 [Microbacterium sp. BK668]
MQCPNDGAVLVMSERAGVEIDYCPTCRGVWLDRGELDKILERAARESAPSGSGSDSGYGSRSGGAQPGYPPQGYPEPGYPSQPGYGQASYDPRYHGKKKKRESWLSELFD